MSRSRLEWAQWMGAKGLNIFIVQPESSLPLGGNSWYLRQSTNPKVIASFFEQTEKCNYGVHPGAEFVVIDLDVKHGKDGITLFSEICAENDIENFLLELDTLMVKTPTGGYHLYFKSPFPVANRNHFPDGIDVRGVIGYVVGPGSHRQDGDYDVVDPDADIADLPIWLEKYMEEPGSKDPQNGIPLIELDQPDNVAHAMDWLQKREPAVFGHGGDDWTYETCQWLRDFGISPELMPFVMNESGWNNRCDPPWSDGELAVKVRNAWTYGQNRPGSKSPAYRAQRLQAGRPAGGWANLITEEQMAELFNPSKRLTLVVDNTVKRTDDIPDDVPDDDDLEPNIDPISGEDRSKRDIWYDILDFIKRGKVREFVIDNWLIAHGIVHLVAKRGTGKSTVALDMAFHIACDLPWCGYQTEKGWKVIYICGEDDEGLELNAKAWIESRGIEPEHGRFRVSEEIIKLTDQRRLLLHIKTLMDWAAGARCVVILDTWQRATSGWAKNDQELMERAVENAELLARHLRGPLLSCVHPPKDGRLTVVGSGVQEDTSTGILTLAGDIQKGIRLEIERMKGPGKGKYVRFNMKPVPLDRNDSFGKPLTGLILEKLAGTESGDTIEGLRSKDDEMRSWAKAIYGVFNWPDKTFEAKYKEPCHKALSILTVSTFLAQLLKDAHDDECPEQEEALIFVNEYCDDLFHHITTDKSGWTKSQFISRLETLFPRKNTINILFNHGSKRLTYVQKSGKPKKDTDKPRMVFQINDTVDGEEENKKKGA